MNSKETEINFNYSARYFDNQLELNKTKAIWFVFHGYGQLAFYFIKKFLPLYKLGIRVIAPEGLSKFYINHEKKRVGATWMTSENRLNDIENYQKYFYSIYSKVINEYSSSPPPVTLLGFSQGAATVCRCATIPEISFNQLVLWAGLLPFDMKNYITTNPFINIPIHFVYGNNDPYLNDERFKEMQKLTNQFDINPIITTFDGKHDIDKDTLVKIASLEV